MRHQNPSVDWEVHVQYSGLASILIDQKNSADMTLGRKTWREGRGGGGRLMFIDGECQTALVTNKVALYGAEVYIYIHYSLVFTSKLESWR